MNRESLAQEFSKISSLKPRFFQSPGRINLIGDHTDYNNGFVMPAAINRYAKMAIALNESGILNLRAIDLNVNFQIPLDQISEPRGAGWMNYFIGVVSIFRSRGVEINGADGVITSDVPNGAGLSSSAALTCCFAYGLNELLGKPFSKSELVDIAQQSEHEFAGVLCGNMDQTASLFGKKGQVLKFDCLSREIEYSPLMLDDYAIVLTDTKVKHSLAETAYNLRRQECEKGLKLVQEEYPEVKSFQDIQVPMLKLVRMPKEIEVRCQFVVEENERVKATEKLLKSGNLQRIGSFMLLSHAGLSEKYEVSCPELDLIVQESRKLEFVLGARMMGGGFGGCTIAIVKRASIASFMGAITSAFQRKFDAKPEFYEFELVEGTAEIF